MKKKSKIENFETLTKALKKAYQNILNKKYGYNGPDIISSSLLCCSLTLKEQFDEEQVKWDTKEKGFDEIDILIRAACQLGIQQGINMCSEKPNEYMEFSKWSEEDFKTFRFQFTMAENMYTKKGKKRMANILKLIKKNE